MSTHVRRCFGAFSVDSFAGGLRRAPSDLCRGTLAPRKACCKLKDEAEAASKRVRSNSSDRCFRFLSSLFRLAMAVQQSGTASNSDSG